MQGYRERLTGGHPNSLGNTEEVVAEVLQQPAYFDELFECYFSDDEIVRMRTSNAMKRAAKAAPELVTPYLDRFIDEVAYIPQASAQWTVAQLMLALDKYLSEGQRASAKTLLKRPFEREDTEPSDWRDDWIVLNMSMATLGHWAKRDAELAAWFRPHLERLAGDRRKSVRGRAEKLLGVVGK